MVQLNNFHGRKLLDIRRFFLDKNSNEYKPTKKGIALNRDNFFEVIGILADRIDDINKWFEAESNTFNKGKIIKALDEYQEEINKIRKRDSLDDKPYEKQDFRDRRFPFAYGFEHNCGVNIFKKNLEHPINSIVNGTGKNRDLAKLIEIIFLSYFKAARRLEDVTNDGYIDTESLELEWDRELRMNIAKNFEK